MNDRPDLDADAFGPIIARPAWAWSHLRKPTVLVLWLACAALSVLLNERRGKRQERPDPMPAPLPRPRPDLQIHRSDTPRPGHGERDDERRAA